ncbi:MAG: hypothetical protein CMM75_08360 [Rhodospirillaceae bacterium]|nr:hypothetical protein [Rhodospirillaceae bacterium]|tara:strand:- start:3718 stop:4287 length:570 start_codon:yes stop_codon:yes gene_type:complete
MQKFNNLDNFKCECGSKFEVILPEFLKTVSALISTFPPADVPSLIAHYLPGLVGCPDLLTPEQRSLNGLDYQKHEVFLCPNDKFSVLAVVWPAGIYSPIHDHKTWCTFGVVEGEIRETIYEENKSENGDVTAVSSMDHRVGSIAHMSINESNIHCMHNPGTDPAVTIHVYGGNFKKIGANVNKIYATHT